MISPNLSVVIPNSSVPGCPCGQDGCACIQYALRLEQRWKDDVRHELVSDRLLRQAEVILAESFASGHPCTQTELAIALAAVQGARSRVR